VKTRTECLPCFLRQAFIALDLISADESLRRSVLAEVLPVISATDFSESPAFTTSILHRKVRLEVGRDPYGPVKEKYNRLVLDLYPLLSQRVKHSPDPLWTATRLAIAGNIIDFGIFREIDLEETLDRALTATLAIDHYREFASRCASSKRVLYLFDNAGEIVFDRLLVETLLQQGVQVTGVVKGGPVINDATETDAEQVGLKSLIPVIPNGSDDVGTWLPGCSEFFREEIERADLVVSKGQANFETLHLDLPAAFFLFQAKCDVLATALRVPKGAMLLTTASGLPHALT